MGRRSRAETLAKSEPAVRAYLAARLRPFEVEDAAQTVMERVLERPEGLDEAERPRAWLLGIARNVAFEVMRARARSPVASEADVPDEVEPSLSAEEQLGLIERDSLLYRALEELRDEDRLALLMTYVDGLRGPEAAEILGVSFPAFRQRLSRARKQAERHLRDLEASPGRVDPASVQAWRAWLDKRARAALPPNPGSLPG